MPTYGPEHFGVCHFTVFVVYLLLARLPGTAKTTASCQGTHWHVDKEFRQSDGIGNASPTDLQPLSQVSSNI